MRGKAVGDEVRAKARAGDKAAEVGDKGVEPTVEKWSGRSVK